MKERAARQDETRRRIAAATATLHEEVGPARTTIAEVARRAGVGRPTVYANFPDERLLFAACQDHYLAAHPPPDPEPALAEAHPGRRVRRTLELFYGWYRETAAMTGNVQRDRRLVPELDALLSETADRSLEELSAALAAGFGVSGRRSGRVRAALRLALDFATWSRLTGEGLTDREAAGLMAAAAQAVAGEGGHRP